jgi:hypothetical protein
MRPNQNVPQTQALAIRLSASKMTNQKPEQKPEPKAAKNQKPTKFGSTTNQSQTSAQR